MAVQYAFTDSIQRSYAARWAAMRVIRVTDAQITAQRLARSAGRYRVIQDAIGVPWEVVAILHNREASGSFDGVLHNGEKIIGTGRTTKLVPEGRGPFKTWEGSAIDALKLKGLDRIKDWPIERICYTCEAFNGWGYRNKGVPSAYLWAGSDQYVSGKYVADHVWDENAVDKQLGAMVVYRALLDLRKTQPSLPPDTPKPLPKPPGTLPSPRGAGASGSIVASIIAALNSPEMKTAIVFLGIGLAAAAIFWFWPKRK